MARKASKAPKERINITYRPATSPNESVELPFKMLVLANITAREDDRTLEERKPIRIDGHNFSDVLESCAPKISLNVPNRLDASEEGQEMNAELEFKSLRDFSPGGVAKQVPELRTLLELRDALSALKSPLGNRRDFRRRMEELLNDESTRAQLMSELGIESQPGGDA